MLCYFHIFLLFMKITKNQLCLSVSRLFLSVWGRGSIKICMCRCFKIQKSVGRTIDDLKPHKNGDIEKKKEKDIV